MSLNQRRYFAFFALMFLLAVKSYGQSKSAQGFVIDGDSKLRLAKVYIYNLANGEDGSFNNHKGEFHIKVQMGDTIVAALSGYAPDTLIYRGQNALVFQLKSLSIKLKEVKITGKAPTPKEQYQKNMQNFKYKIDQGSYKDLLSTGMGTVGLSIDAIYNLLSREGNNARRLQGILEKDYQEAIIDYRFKPEYVKNLLKIDDWEAKDFMMQYRPTYIFALKANEYEFVAYIKKCYASYKRNPNLLRLPQKPKADFDPQKQ